MKIPPKVCSTGGSSTVLSVCRVLVGYIKGAIEKLGEDKDSWTLEQSNRSVMRISMNSYTVAMVPFNLVLEFMQSIKGVVVLRMSGLVPSNYTARVSHEDVFHSAPFTVHLSFLG